MNPSYLSPVADQLQDKRKQDPLPHYPHHSTAGIPLASLSPAPLQYHTFQSHYPPTSSPSSREYYPVSYPSLSSSPPHTPPYRVSTSIPNSLPARSSPAMRYDSLITPPQSRPGSSRNPRPSIPVLAYAAATPLPDDPPCSILTPHPQTPSLHGYEIDNPSEHPNLDHTLRNIGFILPSHTPRTNTPILGPSEGGLSIISRSNTSLQFIGGPIGSSPAPTSTSSPESQTSTPSEIFPNSRETPLHIRVPSPDTITPPPLLSPRPTSSRTASTSSHLHLEHEPPSASTQFQNISCLSNSDDIEPAAVDGIPHLQLAHRKSPRPSSPISLSRPHTPIPHWKRRSRNPYVILRRHFYSRKFCTESDDGECCAVTTFILLAVIFVVSIIVAIVYAVKAAESTTYFSGNWSGGDDESWKIDEAIGCPEGRGPSGAQLGLRCGR